MLHARDRHRPLSTVEPRGTLVRARPAPRDREAGPSSEPLLTAARLAEALGVTRRWIYTQVEEHEMPVYRPPGGRTLLFRMSAVEAWLDAYRHGDWSCGKSYEADGIPDDMQEQPVG